MSLRSLPSEIYAAIVDQLDESVSQSTVLALTRTIPSSPVPQHQLFHRVQFTESAQFLSFYQRIRRTADDPCKWVQILLLETWTADAETALNVLALLPNLHTLSIWIGPKNFTPEHLEELFSVDRKGRCLKCVGNLRHLSLRFRPYVQKATYYQFLSGSYFDPILEALCRWPAGRLSTLSIVQDPFTDESSSSAGSEVAPPAAFSLDLPQRTLATGFAQPIVFFKLEATFPALLRSSIRLSLKSLRLRFPSRNVVRPLTQAPLPQPPSYGAPTPTGSRPSTKYFRPVASAHFNPSPNLTFLDLSTCLITEGSLPQVLVHYSSLTHVVLDDCSILRNGDMAVRDNSREWRKFALECATAGISRARERERKVNKWLDHLQIQQQKPGERRGNKRDRGRGETGSSTLLPSLVRILPPSPTLQHLAATLYVPHSLLSMDTSEALPQHPRDTLLEYIHKEWERGWSEGLSQLIKVRERLKMSWQNRLVRVMRFATSEDADTESPLPDVYAEDSARNVLEEGHFAGLIEVIDVSEFALDSRKQTHMAGSSSPSGASSDSHSAGLEEPPALCLAGTPGNPGPDLPTGNDAETVPVRGLAHTPGCAHEIGRKLWRDGL
ncbi:hypothetical protein D9757_002233 [Collybiopsis confluens]|uniref:F-box domain-containing protein n=1 Tax=Collybiopsis confluens TaxID=2823264 RepID=A0A8H5I0E8_9AGAR|nr:hypothetical protein D9757_002233 [Collybiopsis confluens]